MEENKSPFKFLDPYTLEDRERFFGRDKEISELYELAFDTNLILVYGPSGAGKTSLVQCGLANRFSGTDWFDLHVRRRDNINTALKSEVEKSALTPIREGMSPAETVQSLYLDFFKPIYLIFDQFEELYILGSESERNTFFQSIKNILSLDFPRKIIIIMREEYIAQLYDFEKILPQIFDHRLRVEPMSATNVEKVIRGSLAQFNIEMENPEETIQRIIQNISQGKSRVQLSYLQIYLDRLYKEAVHPKNKKDE